MMIDRGNLYVFHKRDDGILSIAVGCTNWCLVTKLTCKYNGTPLATKFQPYQGLEEKDRQNSNIIQVIKNRTLFKHFAYEYIQNY